MSNKKIDNRQGHWVLAKMGKKVLRPGGKELTEKLIEYLKINTNDDVVEFAPGLGFTAKIAIKNNPKSYTGIELNDGAAEILRKKIHGKCNKIIVANAMESTLNTESYTKVYGEAMLTMQADSRKSKIICEAHRILKKGGLYAIHELGLEPNDISEDIKIDIYKALSTSIQVNARPLTMEEWIELLQKNGFKVITKATNPMHLLELKRMIDDEGLLRTMKIIFNVLTHKEERKRILHMRKVFRKYEEHLCSVCLVAEKL